MDSKPPPDSPFAAYNRKWQAMLDSTTPFPLPRWALTATLFGLYILRIYVAGGWYIVSYALGIYVLSLVLQFLSPKIDPALEMDEDGPSLPTNMEDEFKPFIRRLPEFKFWYSATRAVSVALFCAMFRIFDVPVFWPILLIYFIVLLYITMKRQIKHMIKYKYLPFDFAKPKPGTGSSGVQGVVHQAVGQVQGMVQAAKGK